MHVNNKVSTSNGHFYEFQFKVAIATHGQIWHHPKSMVSRAEKSTVITGTARTRPDPLHSAKDRINSFNLATSCTICRLKLKFAIILKTVCGGWGGWRYERAVQKVLQHPLLFESVQLAYHWQHGPCSSKGKPVFAFMIIFIYPRIAAPLLWSIFLSA